MPALDALGLGVLLALLAALALAIQTVCLRYGTVTSRSGDALVVVLLVNVAFLVPAAFVLGAPLHELNLRSVAAFATAGLVGTMAGRACFFEGVKRIGASRAESVKASQPLHATLIAVVILHETVTPGHVLSMVAIVGGVVLISYEHTRSGGESGGYTALLFPLGAALFYGIEPVFAKVGFATGASVASGLAVKTLVATLAFLAYLAYRHGLPRIDSFERRELPWLVGAGLGNTGFLVGYYAALELERVSVVLPLVEASPLFVIALSALFVSDDLERVTPRLVLAAIVVVGGAVGVALLS
jgi:DME family drug/metabolite transporter